MPLSQEFAASFGRLAANHLWQSTGFAAVAVLLALALRSNHARVLYWLWLVASVKFLVPFSVLAAIGSSLGRWLAPAAPVSPLPFVMEQIVQPFAPIQDAALPAVPAPATANLLPALLLALWFCGFAAVLLYAWLRWCRVAAAVHAATPLTESREMEALRRLQWGPPCLPGLVASSAKLEPGVFGVLRPILWLPAGIGDRLEDAELEAILAHELCHVRRRDNLAAVIQMAVEAIFWFHPVVWWLGSRLEEERERACDEEVVRMGGDPQIYTESILKVCEFYLASPVACAAGVTGGELKKRIEGIMTNRFTRELSFAKRLLLASAAVLAIAGPVTVGILHAPRVRAEGHPKFEAASVKPATGRVSPGGNSWGPETVVLRRISPETLLTRAYGVKSYQISGPEWLEDTYFDVFAKTPEGVTQAQIPQMLQALLAERFKLALHRETRTMPVYALVAGNNGPKLKEVVPNATPKDLNGGRVMVATGPHNREVKGFTTMAELANYLAYRLDRPVLDFTDLKGTYDIDLSWRPNEANHLSGASTPGPSVFSALQENLGLKLDPRKEPVEVLVIDHLEKVPTGN
jgi:uncharacterized protein (TIGR03435 family)